MNTLAIKTTSTPQSLHQEQLSHAPNIKRQQGQQQQQWHTQPHHVIPSPHLRHHERRVLYQQRVCKIPRRRSPAAILLQTVHYTYPSMHAPIHLSIYEHSTICCILVYSSHICNHSLSTIRLTFRTSRLCVCAPARACHRHHLQPFILTMDQSFLSTASQAS